LQSYQLLTTTTHNSIMWAAWRTPQLTSFIRSSQAVSRRYGSTIPPRHTGFTVPTKSHVDDIRHLLASPTSVLSTLDDSATKTDLVGYNDDWMNKYHGKSQFVVKPRNTEEVSKVVKYCHDKDIAIVPQAGNTGLVGRLHTSLDRYGVLIRRWLNPDT